MKLFCADLSIDYSAVGVHSWRYWKAALPKSWPSRQGGLGVRWDVDKLRVLPRPALHR
ncbi:hypothetical protein [Nocardia sp. NPDC047038]|uniref:hypothetical protein n=1 Tax=Nocardia sp. NPDC047038 TaxID=3154338 RepID=UPI0033C948B9